MAADPPTLGVVLAGGLARRMGGGDKPLRLLGGRPILAHALRRLAPQVGRIVLNANGDPARFAAVAPNVAVLPDGLPDHPGPLVGILAALDHAAGAGGAEWVVSLPGDTPFPPSDLVARLHAARRGAGTPLACAASGGWTHPPIGLWSVALRDDLRAALLGGERKIDRWTARHGCPAAEWPTLPHDPFLNVNTPEDLASAEAVLRAMSLGPTSGASDSGGHGS